MQEELQVETLHSTHTLHGLNSPPSNDLLVMTGKFTFVKLEGSDAEY